ncbi:MAG: STT3 domain-containing protein [archaeon]
MEYNDIKKFVLEIVSNKKYQWIATVIVFLIVLFVSSSIRTSNWDLLNDSTTGEKIPMALDPFYFLRVAETIVENNGALPQFDMMRAGGIGVEWSSEIMPQVVVELWKMSSIFGDYTLREVDVFSPVLFFGIGLVLFFILVYVLTNSKFAGVLASTFLAFAPAYLYRTMAGFADHDVIGMIGFFGTLLIFSLSMNYLDKMKDRNFIGVGIYGVVLGALTALVIATWGGATTFLFIIIPFGFLLFWIVKLKDKKSVIGDVGILFYVSWVIFTIVFAMLLGYNAMNVINRFISSTGIIGAATLGFIVLDRIFIAIEDKIKTRKYNEKYRILYVLGILIMASFFVLPLIGKNIFGFLWEIINRLLNPFWEASRLDITVAENARTYLTSWIVNTGKTMFYLFLAGIVFIGIGFVKNIKSIKNKILLLFGFLFMVSGILFSQISPSSVLNGAKIFGLSGLFYLGGFGIFAYLFFKIYFEGCVDINPMIIVLFSWMFVMLVTGRSTARMFFVIAPFVCFCAAYFVIMIFRYSQLKSKDEVWNVLVIGLLIISIVASSFVIYSSYGSASEQAKYMGPSADEQWQRAMAWVRENTSKDSIFAHWWDYGYWVQTLGERATIADGGHAQSRFDGNHKIGRYVLTTPSPETALSFFKTFNIDYFLIDSTDLGKYPAYSAIGGGNGSDAMDRYAVIPVMLADAKQTRETANGTMIVYGGGSYLFEDIVYNQSGKDIFLPSGKAALIAIVMELNGNSLGQPEAVYIYNNIQTRIPVRYAYVNDQLIDYGDGLDVVIDIIPVVDGSGTNRMGAVIYLSQKVSKSLFAQLFLLDDAFGNYPTIKIAHTEPNLVVTAMKAQGVDVGDFVYYQGFRGPIKIWDVRNIPEEIKIVEKFKEPFNGTFGALDGIEFK